MKTMKRKSTISIILAFLIFNSYARIINVPAEHSTIQAAIDASSNGDTVLVAEETYFENINFKGKAITLASMFLVDSDTSHIRKTVIDGSQPADTNNASTVMLVSGEDTTSVLAGFTITGGKGTKIDGLHPDGSFLGGGGILILNSGGKIIHNNVISNVLVAEGEGFIGPTGCGIFGWVYGNHTLRDNVIRDNTGTGENAYGGGIFITGGSIHVDRNMLVNNRLSCVYFAQGGGISWFNPYSYSHIEELIIRNNLISGNILESTQEWGMGGGLFFRQQFANEYIEVYNNIITDNQIQGLGGGVYVWGSTRMALYNNTIYKNAATFAGNSIGVEGSNNEFVLFNNILWSDANINDEFWFLYPDRFNKYLQVHYNLLGNEFDASDPVIETNNIVTGDPDIIPESYELDTESPAIGKGIDTIEVFDRIFTAPERDYSGNQRPDKVDSFVDIGAIESPYLSVIDGVSETRMADIGLYPNPARDQLTIHLETMPQEPKYIEITSLNGQLVDKSVIRESTIHIDLSHLQSGVYLITVRTRDFIKTEKLIKLQ
jgi:parallel beta-helix repeat protein